MQKIFDQIKQGLVFGITIGVSASAIFYGTYFAIKARTTSSGTTDSSPTSIYAETNGTLSAAKRNTLVDKTQRKDMDINDTTTTFNTGCERKFYDNTAVTYTVSRINSNTELRRRYKIGTAQLDGEVVIEH